jgi:hypothetical protein
MIGQIIGFVRVKEQLEHSTYLFGDNAEVAGKTLRVWERNDEGDCLCLDPKGSNLVDIDNRDVAEFIKLPENNLFDLYINVFKNMCEKP